MKSVLASLNSTLVALAIASAISLPAWATGQAEVMITVKDEVGTPVQGVEIVLTPLDINEKPISAAPWTSKTGKKGTTQFPFLPYNAQGEGRYDVSIKREGFYIHE